LALPQEAIKAFDIVGRRKVLAVACQKVGLIGRAERAGAPAFPRQACHGIRVDGGCGIQASYQSGAGERGETQEVIPDLRHWYFGADAILGLSTQDLGLRPIRILPQETPDRHEICIGPGGGPQDAPLDIAFEQRLADICYHRASIRIATVVECLQRPGKHGQLGGGQRSPCANGLSNGARWGKGRQ